MSAAGKKALLHHSTASVNVAFGQMIQNVSVGYSGHVAARPRL